MHIRNERPKDAAAISAVLRDAFAGDPHGSGSEPAIVEALRAAGALTVSLVAGEASDVVGHVAFSPVAIDGDTGHWYALGPLAVAPGSQRQGIGSALVRTGLDRLHAMGAAGCVVLGSPRFYGRFGFDRHEGLIYPGPPPEFFLARVFRGHVPRGVVAYHPAFVTRA